MNIVLFDTETIGYQEDFPNEDILCQLAYLHLKGKEFTLGNTYLKPERYLEMTPGAMSCNKLTPEILADKETKEESNDYQYLKNLLENTDEIVYLIAHNVKFDLEVIELSGIKPNYDKVKIIDTLKIANFINDNNNLMYKECKLQYLKYYYRLDKKRDALDKKLDIDSSKLDAHDALPDVLDLFLVYNHFLKDMSGTAAMLHELTIEPLVLNLVPFGKNRGDSFDTLSWNQLKWYATLDGDVGYTARKLMGDE